jgi:hypothetical protein
MAIAKKIARRLSPQNMSYYMQRKIRKPSSRDKVASYLCGRLPKPTNNEDVTAEIEELNKSGIVFLPDSLTPEQVAEVVAWMKQTQLQNAHFPGTFTYDHAPEGAHVGMAMKSEIAKCPHILNIANSPKYLSIASKFLGCQPTISLITAWWSYGGRSKAVDAENFHRDVDDWKFLKFFTYLTDVDDEAGPHVYVKNSSNSDKLIDLRRFEDKEVEETFGKENVLSITGKAGSTFMENTYGIHKGTLPRSKNRLVMQIEYSLRPIPYDYKPVPESAVTVTHKLDPYINRLFVAHAG